MEASWAAAIGGSTVEACLTAQESPNDYWKSGCAGLFDDWGGGPDEDSCTDGWYAECCRWDEDEWKCLPNEAAYDCGFAPGDGGCDGADEDKCTDYDGTHPWHAVCCEWKQMQCKEIVAADDEYPEMEINCENTVMEGKATAKSHKKLSGHFSDIHDCADACLQRREDTDEWWISGVTFGKDECLCEGAMHGVFMGGWGEARSGDHHCCFLPPTEAIKERLTCSKSNGYHDGHVVRELPASVSPWKGWWSWQACANECAQNGDCEFWTLQQGEGKSCKLMNYKGDFHRSDEFWWGDKQEWCYTRMFVETFTNDSDCMCRSLIYDDWSSNELYPPFCYNPHGDKAQCFLSTDDCPNNVHTYDKNRVKSGHGTIHCTDKKNMEVADGYQVQWAGERGAK